jgi:hypothetical protein
MGIEVVAMNNVPDAFLSKFDEARHFALTGDKKRKWWYIQYEKTDEASNYICSGVTTKDWYEKVKLEVLAYPNNQEIFHLQLLYLDMFTPLTTMLSPDIDEGLEPTFRLFWV